MTLSAAQPTGIAIDAQQKIRVLHLGSPIGLYGAERWILALLNYLPPERIESIVGVIRDDPGLGEIPICAEAAALGLQTVEFESHGRVSASAVRKLRRYLTECDIDVLHTHGYKTDIIGMLAAMGTHCQVVATPHGWSTDAGLKLQIYEYLDRLAFHFVDAVVPLSPDLHAGLKGYPLLSGKLRLILNGVDLSEIEAAKGDVTDSFLRQDDVFVYGYIGQLIPRKGLVSLINAFARLDDPRKRLCIVGEGPQRAELEELVSSRNEMERVQFLGYREDRLELLKCFDAFVLPSSLEGIPRCLMEAMAAGVPVLASNIPGCTDLVSPGDTGLLFDFGDEVGIEHALAQVSGDTELAERFARNGRQLVNDRYSAAAMASNYTELYAELCQENKVSRRDVKAGS
jgi:glycosyltransferase involved in cell wall biosynthesis